MSDVAVDPIFLGFVEDLVPSAGVEAVVERAMAVVWFMYLVMSG